MAVVAVVQFTVNAGVYENRSAGTLLLPKKSEPATDTGPNTATVNGEASATVPKLPAVNGTLDNLVTSWATNTLAPSVVAGLIFEVHAPPLFVNAIAVQLDVAGLPPNAHSRCNPESATRPRSAAPAPISAGAPEANPMFPSPSSSAQEYDPVAPVFPIA